MKASHCLLKECFVYEKVHGAHDREKQCVPFAALEKKTGFQFVLETKGMFTVNKLDCSSKKEGNKTNVLLFIKKFSRNTLNNPERLKTVQNRL